MLRVQNTHFNVLPAHARLLAYNPRMQNSMSPKPSKPYTPNNAAWPCAGVVCKPCM